jgi:hypothetical protein
MARRKSHSETKARRVRIASALALLVAVLVFPAAALAWHATPGTVSCTAASYTNVYAPKGGRATYQYVITQDAGTSQQEPLGNGEFTLTKEEGVALHFTIDDAGAHTVTATLTSKEDTNFKSIVTGKVNGCASPEAPEGKPKEEAPKPKEEAPKPKEEAPKPKEEAPKPKEEAPKPTPTPPPTSKPPAPAPAPVQTAPVPQAPSSAVAPFAATGRTRDVVAPALNGPQGCLRPGFVASVNAAGVQSVTFYLDGHRLRTLAGKSVRHGKLSISLKAATLRLGGHRLVASITMASAAPSAKPVVTLRGLTVVRCASATLVPKFTG